MSCECFSDSNTSCPPIPRLTNDEVPEPPRKVSFESALEYPVQNEPAKQRKLLTVLKFVPFPAKKYSWDT